MLSRWKIKQAARKTVSVVAAACVFTACASTELENTSNETADSDASILLDQAVPATEVSDAGAFADLEATAPAATEVEASQGAVPAAQDGSPYYNSLGGESLRRVAHTLYSDKSFARQLLEKNPELKGVDKLGAEQKVFFDLETVKPEPTYLTKDLLDRYAGQLADRLNMASSEQGISKTTVTLNQGETLQELSKRLYGTSRYWTEIYLVNHDKIQNYDKVASGMSLTVLSRPNAAVAASAEPVAAAPMREKVQAKVSVPAAPQPVQQVEPTPAEMPTQPDPVASQPTPVDPIPETPVAPEPAPEPVAPVVAEAPRAAPAPEPEISSSNALTRPIIYAVLVLLILGVGFYFTRSPKKNKVDMLDITAADGAGRPKLATKDSQKSNIG